MKNTRWSRFYAGGTRKRTSFPHPCVTLLRKTQRCHGRGHRLCHARGCTMTSRGSKPRPAPAPPSAGASPPPGRALPSRGAGWTGPCRTVPRGRGNAMRFLFRPKSRKTLHRSACRGHRLCHIAALNPPPARNQSSLPRPAVSSFGHPGSLSLRPCNPHPRAVDARHFTGGVRACRGEIPVCPPVGP